MIALINQIPTEAKIRKELRRIIFGDHIRCPRCHTRSVYCSEDRYRCVYCRRPFALLTGTWLEGTKLNLRTVWALLWCWTQRVSVQQTMALVHCSEPTVRHWYQEFRRQVPEIEAILEGQVQMDEAYFRNISLLMAKQVGTRAVAHAVLSTPSVNRGDAAAFIFHHVAPRSRLQTDGASIYKTIDQWWPVTHRVDIHRKFQFGLTSEIEGMFGNLRTFIRRMYHHVTPEYLPEYVAEFTVRFSHPELFDSPRIYLSKTLCPVPSC